MAHKKQKEPKPYKRPVLFLAYWYTREGEKDACTFIGDAESKTTGDNQFLHYAKLREWGVKERDIEDVYILNTEEDKHGRSYQIAVSRIESLQALLKEMKAKEKCLAQVGNDFCKNIAVKEQYCKKHYDEFGGKK